MRPIVRLGYLAASCALLVATFSIIGPRAVRAAVATLVQVANTSANPVPNADVNAPGVEPFQAQFCLVLGGTFYTCSGPDDFVVPSFTTDGASVKRAVVTTVTGSCAQNPSTNIVTSSISVYVGGKGLSYFSPLQANPTDPGYSFSIMGPAPLYADPGTPIFSSGGVSGGGSAECFYNLAGYYVTH